MVNWNSLPAVYAKAFGYIFAPPLIIYAILSLLPINKWFMYFITFSLIYVVISSIFVVYLYLAEKGVCFLLAQENIATLIQCGGQFSKVVYSSREFEIDEDFEVKPKTRKNKDSWMKERLRGLTFYGITPFKEILFIDLKHNKLIEREIEGNREIEYRVHKTKKRTSRIDLKITNYSMFFGEMETKDRNQVYAIVTATLRVSNVYTFLKNRDPYARLEEFLWSAFRNFVRDFDTDELIGKGQVDEKIDKNIKIKAMLGKQFFDYLSSNDHKTNLKIELIKDGQNKDRMKIENLGFEIMNFSVLDINLKDKTAEEASKMLYIADKKREAVIIEAEAEAEKIKTVATADAERIKLIAKMCKEYGISPELQMLIEKMGTDQANYMFWHGDFFKEVPRNGKAAEFNEEDLRRILSTILKSLEKERKP